jgi:hypothetical protein
MRDPLIRENKARRGGSGPHRWYPALAAKNQVHYSGPDTFNLCPLPKSDSAPDFGFLPSAYRSETAASRGGSCTSPMALAGPGARRSIAVSPGLENMTSGTERIWILNTC